MWVRWGSRDSGGGGGGTESVQGVVYHQTRSMMNYPDNILYVSINSKIFT